MKETSQNPSPDLNSATLSPLQARRILYSLMVPAIFMPLSSWMFAVALPVIRDAFAIQADVAGWVSTAFSLPFMILMPVYGRLSDGLGKRRLLLVCGMVFAAGSAVAAAAPSLSWLIAGRVIMGVGASGVVPLCMALISAIYVPEKRGKALGLWSTTGPATGTVGPVLAGFVIAAWGWRASFVPALIVALIGVGIVYRNVPSGLVARAPGFLRTFDWLGAGLLSATLVLFLFFLSSEPITGVAPLQDWRLLLSMVLFLAAYVYRERRCDNPLIHLNLFANRSFMVASVSASLRMLIMSGGLGFLLPLFLTDIYNLSSTQIGFVALWNPAVMLFIVRRAGRLSDRFGSRGLVMIGFTLQAAVMGMLAILPATVSPAVIALTMAVHGLGAGLMLASLHRAALTSVSDEDLGPSSGLYSMIRFMGSVVAPALGGVLLQGLIDRDPTDLLAAYQGVYLFYAGAGVIGLLMAAGLPRRV